jgi:hypothetical protein
MLAPMPPEITTVLPHPTLTPAAPPLLPPPTATEAAGMREEVVAATAAIALEDTVATEEDTVATEEDTVATEEAVATATAEGVMDRREQGEVTQAIEAMEVTEGMILAEVVTVATLTAAAMIVLLHQEIATGPLLRETPVATPLPVVAAAMVVIRSDR